MLMDISVMQIVLFFLSIPCLLEAITFQSFFLNQSPKPLIFIFCCLNNSILLLLVSNSAITCLLFDSISTFFQRQYCPLRYYTDHRLVLCQPEKKCFSIFQCVYFSILNMYQPYKISSELIYPRHISFFLFLLNLNMIH